MVSNLCGNIFLRQLSQIVVVAISQICVKSVQIRSFFWSIFSCIRTEYESVRIQENTDQKKLRIWTLFTQCKFFKSFRYRKDYRLENYWKQLRSCFIKKVFSKISKIQPATLLQDTPTQLFS